MNILTENGVSRLEFSYPYGYRVDSMDKHVGHENLAKLIAEKGWKTYMVIACCDMLADEHWDDPDYMHKTNHLLVCKALQEVRKGIVNRYFSRDDLDALIKKYNFPAKEFNYKEDEARAFKFRVEDELFHYQETVSLVKCMIDVMDTARYKLDEEGYPLHDDDDEMILEFDEDVIEKQKELLFERFLIPNISTTHDRVYNMPNPLTWWDYRSGYHQAFYIEVPEENITFGDMGGGGSSGRRESNGRWAHTFGLLATKYGVETPTFFTRYDPHNVWREDFRLPTFAALRRDLSGNYQSTREIMEPLFKGRVYDMSHNDKYEYLYEKITDGLYY